MISIQTAPQVRLIQNNDQSLVEKIQSSSSPPSRSGRTRSSSPSASTGSSRRSSCRRTSPTRPTSCWPRTPRCCARLGRGGRETERGVVDIETLKKVNDDLIATLEETIRIQAGGHQQACRRGRAGAHAGRPEAEAGVAAGRQGVAPPGKRVARLAAGRRRRRATRRPRPRRARRPARPSSSPRPTTGPGWR